MKRLCDEIFCNVVRLAVTSVPASIWNKRQATDIMHILRVLEQLGHRPGESVQGWRGNSGGQNIEMMQRAGQRGVRYVNRGRTDGHSVGGGQKIEMIQRAGQRGVRYVNRERIDGHSVGGQKMKMIQRAGQRGVRYVNRGRTDGHSVGGRR